MRLYSRQVFHQEQLTLKEMFSYCFFLLRDVGYLVSLQNVPLLLSFGALQNHEKLDLKEETSTGAVHSEHSFAVFILTQRFKYMALSWKMLGKTKIH